MILSGYSSRIFEMRSVPRASATSEGVSELEPLKTITALSLLPHHVQHAVHQLGTLCVVALGPVIASPALPEHEVIGPEDLAKRPGPHAVHGTGLQVDKDSPGDVLASAGLVVVHIDPLKLQVRVAMVGSGGVDAMLI